MGEIIHKCLYEFGFCRFSYALLFIFTTDNYCYFISDISFSLRVMKGRVDCKTVKELSILATIFSYPALDSRLPCLHICLCHLSFVASCDSFTMPFLSFSISLTRFLSISFHSVKSVTRGPRKTV